MNNIQVPKKLVWTVFVAILCGVFYHVNFRISLNSTDIKEAAIERKQILVEVKENTAIMKVWLGIGDKASDKTTTDKTNGAGS